MVLLLGALELACGAAARANRGPLSAGPPVAAVCARGRGVISQLGLLAEHGLRLLVVIVVSTWVGMAVTALVLRQLMRPAPPPGDSE